MSPDVTDQEADEMLDHLHQLADQWRERLRDPAMRQLVERGLVKINPLVLKLLKISPVSIQ